MRYRKLGRTGIEVSILGFGCMRLPTEGSPDKIDEIAAARLLHRAIEAGVNYVDTAWFYHATSFGQEGQSEPFVGRALQGGRRDRVQLATKLPQQIVKTRGDMDRFLERQLERLGTDHIDFYLVHGLDGEAWDRMRDLGVREFLDGAVSRGLIRFPAFSFHGGKSDFPRIIDEYDGWAFGQLGMKRLEALIQPANEASIRTAERAGFSTDGTSRICCSLSGERHAHVVYVLPRTGSVPVDGSSAR